MSKEALDALVNTNGGHQGATVQAAPQVLAELREAGVIGMGNGLTRSGSILRERENTTRLEEMFG